MESRSPWWIRWHAYVEVLFGVPVVLSLTVTDDYLSCLSAGALPAVVTERLAEHTWRRAPLSPDREAR